MTSEARPAARDRAFAALIAHCDCIEAESDESVWVAFRVAVENARAYVEEAVDADA